MNPQQGRTGKKEIHFLPARAGAKSHLKNPAPPATPIQTLLLVHAAGPIIRSQSSANESPRAALSLSLSSLSLSSLLLAYNSASLTRTPRRRVHTSPLCSHAHIRMRIHVRRASFARRPRRYLLRFPDAFNQVTMPDAYAHSRARPRVCTRSSPAGRGAREQFSR